MPANRYNATLAAALYHASVTPRQVRYQHAMLAQALAHSAAARYTVALARFHAARIAWQAVRGPMPAQYRRAVAAERSARFSAQLAAQTAQAVKQARASFVPC